MWYNIFMKIIIQRVKNASCTIDNKIYSEINHGYLLLVGFTQNDDIKLVEKLANKLVNLRIFNDINDKMNLSIKDVGGTILSISQFTLYANSKKGNRPSFIEALKPDEANQLYNYFNDYMRKLGLTVKTGVFGEDMKIDLLNDGPVTIILDSKEL